MASDPVIPEGFEVETAQIPEGFSVETPDQRRAGDVRRQRAERIQTESNVGAAVRRGGEAGQAVLQGATLGFADEIQSVIAAAVAAPFVSDKTFGQLMVDARKAFREEYAAAGEDSPRLATLPVVGDVTAQDALTLAGGLPVAAPAVMSGTGAGALMGGLAGAGFADKENFLSIDTAVQAALGAATGAAFGYLVPKVVGGLTRAVRRLTGRPELRIFDESGQFTDDALRELEKLDATPDEIEGLMRKALQDDGILTPEQAQRFNLFRRRNVEPTRFNVTQAVDDSVQQQSALKRSGAVAERVAAQDRQLVEAVEGGLERMRPRASNLVETNANVFGAVDDVVTRVDEAVGAAYKAARQVATGQPRVTLDNLSKAISDARGQEKVTGGVISAARNFLRNKGALRKDVRPSIHKRDPRLKAEQTRQITVKEAEELRQELNSLWDSVTPQGRRIIRQLKDAIDEDVAGAVGEDIFREARAAKTAFQRMIERGRRNKFDKTKGGFLEDVIDNKIPEEKIVPKLLAGRDDDFLKFKTFLTKDAGEAGLQAWQDVKAQALRNALDKGTSVIGKGENGQGMFNARLFRNEINKLKQSKKYTELFDADERQLIEDIIDIGQLRVPVSMVQQGKGPSELVGDSIRKEIARRVPLFGEKLVELSDAIGNLRQDRRLLDVARPSAERLSRSGMRNR